MRIYPGFIVAALFSALIAAPLLSSDVGEYWRQFSPQSFIPSAMNLNLKLPLKGVNGSLWSIRYEFMCYLVVAAMGLLGVLRRKSLVIAALVFCLGYYAGQIHLGWRVPGSRLSWLYCYPENWPRVMSAFLSGVVAYLYRDRIVLSNALGAISAVVLGLGAFMSELKLLPVLVPVAGAYLLLFLSFQARHLPMNFAKHGDFSYGLYLYAFPIQRFLVKRYSPSLTPMGLFLAAFVLSMGAAYLSWHLVERPCLRLTRSRRLVEPAPPVESAPVMITPANSEA